MELVSTTQVIRVVTDAAVTVDTMCFYVDRSSGPTYTPGNHPVNISTATTTTVMPAPAASTTRRMKLLRIRNRASSGQVTVTTQLYDSSGGTTTIELDKRVLGPGQSILMNENGDIVAPSSGGLLSRPWWGLAAGCSGDGNPEQLIKDCQRAGNVAATPTNIGTSVARCSSFRLPYDLTVNRIRAFGVGVVTTTYRVAIYRMSDLARLTAELAFSTAVDTWVSIGSALNVALLKDVEYFVACSVNATGTTAGLLCHSGTVAATTGRINTTPAALPGNLSASAGKVSGFHFQFAVTTGALPATAATLAAQAAWTGGMPAFWLDNSDT